MNLRTVASADASLLAGLHAACFAEGWSAAAISGLLSAPGAFAFLGEIEGIAAGFVLARTAADEAEILTLAVAPDFRRRGLARALLRAAAAEAAKRRAAVLFLEVDSENIAARELYDALGFAEVGRRGAYYARKGTRAGDALTLKLTL
ncbi:MAG: GNAT family N-acetyltransferase [Alphaproteobacteria bacterium]|nr:GNAT family N-acetyltransferase [Alphaproteobacteria bacterium]MDE2011933.1 GNAT family N-acetyltransferase [Alphaproteobacteria bacterium]MDE2072500.1 GNAT family N-acetyltransferase [Alphaproteobacteria bacterium]MDE2351119.1 GNAT family N-acetyltransferase [Alphaproteobacteria bacterium]